MVSVAVTRSSHGTRSGCKATARPGTGNIGPCQLAPTVIGGPPAGVISGPQAQVMSDLQARVIAARLAHSVTGARVVRPFTGAQPKERQATKVPPSQNLTAGWGALHRTGTPNAGFRPTRLKWTLTGWLSG